MVEQRVANAQTMGSIPAGRSNLSEDRMNRREFVSAAGAVMAATVIPFGVASASTASGVPLVHVYLEGCVRAGHLSPDEARWMAANPEQIPWSRLPVMVHAVPTMIALACLPASDNGVISF
jgi:hypothetical protein